MKRTAVVALLLLAAATSLSAAPLSLRGGITMEHARGTAIRDVDCTETNPPALFGCGDGHDGRSLAARGDWEDGVGFTLGVGWQVSRHGLWEVVLTHRTGFEFDGMANFHGVSVDQPVEGGGNSTTLMLVGTYVMGPEVLNARPFLTAGGGAARNRLGATTYSFPAIAPDAVTIVHGGRSIDFAWTAGGGITWAIDPGLNLDLSLTYTYLGEFRSGTGLARIVRPEGTTEMHIAATRADLDTIAFGASFRYTFD